VKITGSCWFLDNKEEEKDSGGYETVSGVPCLDDDEDEEDSNCDDEGEDDEEGV
jgi:hypothetical protein